MPQSFASLYLHLVFSTKNREPRIASELQPQLFEYIGGIARKCDCQLHAAGGMPDHVHLLVSSARTMSVSDLLRTIKASSSNWLHEEMSRPDIAWQTGYAAFSVSHSNVPSVREYLACQAEHHRTVTFQEGFRAFLKRHNIDYDERYLWD